MHTIFTHGIISFIWSRLVLVNEKMIGIGGHGRQRSGTCKLVHLEMSITFNYS